MAHLTRNSEINVFKISNSTKFYFPYIAINFFRVVKSEVRLQDILDKWVNYLKWKEIMSRIDFEM